MEAVSDKKCGDLKAVLVNGKGLQSNIYGLTTMTQERLQGLSLLCIESELARTVNYESAIQSLARKKSRKALVTTKIILPKIYPRIKFRCQKVSHGIDIFS